MRPRTEAALAVGALAALLALASALGQRRNSATETDWRPSTFVAGPYGTRALAEGLARLHIQVQRERTGLRRLPRDSFAEQPIVFALLDPSRPLGETDVRHLLDWSEATGGGHLLLAGPGAEPVMRCFGFTLDSRAADSVSVSPPDAESRGDWPLVAGLLARRTESTVTDTSQLADGVVTECTVPTFSAAETLLVGPGRRVSALRLTRAADQREITLLSDVGLLRNRALRETDAGIFALGLFAGRYGRAIFAEAEHGFAAGGSLAGATIEWSRRSPLGWAAWQLALLGLLVLLAGAFRFGPVRRVIVRRRRSPLEHVRALATALSAARGHDVAIAAMVRGLRRRLNPAARARGEIGPWLAQLAANVRTPKAREAVQSLEQLTRPGQRATSVLRAANAVEDVWEELSP